MLSTLCKAYLNGNDGLVTYKDLEAALQRVTPLPHYGVLPGHEDGGFVFVANTATPPSPSNEQSLIRNPPASSPTPPPGDMIFVSGGTFEMGDQFGDVDNDEKPLHPVTLSDYYLARTELTNADFVAFLNAEGYQQQGGAEWYDLSSSYAKIKGSVGNFYVESSYEQHPVVEVSWYGAVSYCNWRSRREGLTPAYRVSGTDVTADWSATGYRLPTEAEWEYAARSRGHKEKWAGTSNESDLPSYANCGGDQDDYDVTAPVASLRANDLGLADMSGNVYEWCWDWYGNYPASALTDPRGPWARSFRVSRSGSWSYGPAYARCAFRSYNTPDRRGNSLGFRLARAGR